MRLATVLLLLVIIATVGSFPSAISQTFTTITNVSTGTNLVSTNVSSTETVRVVTVTVNSTDTFWNSTVTVMQTGGRLCYYRVVNVTIEPGTTGVLGTIGPPSYEVNFYILNQKQYQDFASGTICGSYSGGTMMTRQHLTSAYWLEWKNPLPGQYAFIFWESSGSVFTVTIPVVIWAIINKSIVSTSYMVIELQPVTLTATRTLTSIQIKPISSGVESISSLMLIGAAVIVLVVVGLFCFRSRRMKK